MRAVVAGAAGQIVASAAGVITVTILAAILVFFFLQDGDRAWVWIFQAVSDQKRERITEAGDDALVRVGGYLRGTTILSAIIALTDLVFMLVLGVPLAVPLAVLVFFSGYIPYFGGIVTTMIIFLVTYASLGAGPVVVMILMIVIRNAILGYGIRPAIYGRTVSIHPAIVLVALPAGFQLAGVIGLFAAVPVTAVVLAVAAATVAIVDPGPRPTTSPPSCRPGSTGSRSGAGACWWPSGMVALVVLVFQTVPLVVVPVILATILAATLDPLVRILLRRGQSQGRASAIAIGGGFLAITAVVVVTFVVLVGQLEALGSTAVTGAGSASSAAGGTLGLLVSAVRTGGADLIQTAAAFASVIGSVVVVILLSVLLSFYFLKDGGRPVGSTTPRACPARGRGRGRGSREPGVRGAERVHDRHRSHLAGRRDQPAGHHAGARHPARAADLRPVVLPVLHPLHRRLHLDGPRLPGHHRRRLDARTSRSWRVWTVVFNLVTGNIVSPLVYGKTVHLHPAVVLVAIPAGAAFGGILGMFVVVPFIGIVADGLAHGPRRHRHAPAGVGSAAAPDVVPAEAVAEPASARPATEMSAAGRRRRERRSRSPSEPLDQQPVAEAPVAHRQRLDRPSFSITIRTMHAPARMTSARFGWRPTMARRVSVVAGAVELDLAVDVGAVQDGSPARRPGR